MLSRRGLSPWSGFAPQGDKARMKGVCALARENDFAGFAGAEESGFTQRALCDTKEK